MTLTSKASYFAVGIWCLMTVVLANAYAGTLLSFLSVAKLEPIINSLTELANSEDVQLVIQARSEMAIRFLVRNVEKNNIDTLHTYVFKKYKN